MHEIVVGNALPSTVSPEIANRLSAGPFRQREQGEFALLCTVAEAGAQSIRLSWSGEHARLVHTATIGARFNTMGITAAPGVAQALDRMIRRYCQLAELNPVKSEFAEFAIVDEWMYIRVDDTWVSVSEPYVGSWSGRMTVVFNFLVNACLRGEDLRTKWPDLEEADQLLGDMPWKDLRSYQLQRNRDYFLLIRGAPLADKLVSMTPYYFAIEQAAR